MMIVYALYHVHDLEDEAGVERGMGIPIRRPNLNELVPDCAKRIGVFSSLENAEAVILNLVKQVGFKDHPDGFRLAPYEVDKDYWVGGFELRTS